MKGKGLLEREAGKLPPKVRTLVAQVGDEEIKTITLFRHPISVSKFLKFIGALKGTPYDDLMHLGMVINGKYIFDKQEVIKFYRSSVPSGSETLAVPVNKKITISELIEKTKKRMGDNDFTRYSSSDQNCQDLMLNVLAANGLSSSQATQFIKQDLEKVFKNLPPYAKKIADFVTGASRVVERVSEGEGKKRKKKVKKN